MSQLDVRIGDKVKSVDSLGCEVVGNLIQMGEEFYLYQESPVYESNVYIGFTTMHYKVYRNKCAKFLAQLQNGDDIFHGDVYSTYEGLKFCIFYNDLTMSVIYIPISSEVDLPPDINIYECYYVGNMIVNDDLELES